MPISSIVVLELFILNIQKFLPLLWIKLLHISIILLWQSYWRKAFCYHCPLSILVEYEENGTRHFYFWFFCAPYYSIIKQLTNPPAAMPCRGMVTKMFCRRYRKLPGQKTTESQRKSAAELILSEKQFSKQWNMCSICFWVKVLAQRMLCRS